MSNKLTFEEWAKREAIRFSPYIHFSHKAWNFAQAQEQKEIEELKRKVESLNQSVIDGLISGGILKKQEEIEELKKKVEELEKENESLKKKLENADKIVKMCEDDNFIFENIHEISRLARAYFKENV